MSEKREPDRETSVVAVLPEEGEGDVPPVFEESLVTDGDGHDMEL